MKSSLSFLIVSLLAATLSAEVRTHVELSDLYHVDRIYKSMEGPSSTKSVVLPANPGETVWVEGIRVEMVGEDGRRLADEYMCHVNVDLDVDQHRLHFPRHEVSTARLVTLSQGYLASDYPEGFAFPLAAGEPMNVTTQVLNLNHPEIDLKVRHKVIIRYRTTAADAKETPRALTNVSVYNRVPIAPPAGQTSPLTAFVSETGGGDHCLATNRAKHAMAGSDILESDGTKTTGHWNVPPGEHTVVTDVTSAIGTDREHRLHHAAVHLHPFAEWIELRDKTTGSILFHGKVKNRKDGIGLEAVESFASAEGIVLPANHKFELVSHWDNPTSDVQDAMAVLYLGVGASAEEAEQMLDPVATPESLIGRVVIETNVGRLVLNYHPDGGASAEYFRTLAKSGALNGLAFQRVEPGFIAQTSDLTSRQQPLTADQQKLLRRTPRDVGGFPNRRGVVGFARDEADPSYTGSSFYVLVGDAPHLDGHFKAFARVKEGLEDLEFAIARNMAIVIQSVTDETGAPPASAVNASR
jgi:cyclophilin family peptidyl-prolyl cis-trans isomerase